MSLLYTEGLEFMWDSLCCTVCYLEVIKSWMNCFPQTHTQTFIYFCLYMFGKLNYWLGKYSPETPNTDLDSACVHVHTVYIMMIIMLFRCFDLRISKYLCIVSAEIFVFCVENRINRTIKHWKFVFMLKRRILNGFFSHTDPSLWCWWRLEQFEATIYKNF